MAETHDKSARKSPPSPHEPATKGGHRLPEGDGPKPPGTPKPGGWERFRSPIIWAVLVLLGLFLFQSLMEDAGVKQVAYSEFKSAIRDGQFEKVVIARDWVKGFPLASSAVDPRDRQTAEGEGPIRATQAPEPWMANRVPDDEGLIQLLEQENVVYDHVPDSGFGSLFWIWIVPIGLAILLWSFLMRRMSGSLRQGAGGPQGLMAFGKSKARVHAESDTGVSFEDVAGIEEAVDELQEIVQFLQTPEKYRRLGGKIPKGVLLVGPPGTGKTLLARAVAGEANVPFFSLSGSEFVEMFVGVGAARVRDLFQQAQTRAPCIIFIDELDALAKKRDSGSIMGGHDEREQTLNQLLNEMDGFDPKVGLIVIAATNRPEILDQALLRPGRFDRQVLVDRPDKRGRLQILQIHVREIKLSDDVQLGEIATGTPGFAGADLANVCNEAALLAARRNADAVYMRDFNEAIERVVAGLRKKNRRMNEDEKRTVAYHESGHALVAISTEHAEPVHKVSIIPHGFGALGYTMQLPLEDRYLMRFEELRDKLAGILGGRAAEEVVFGTVSTGASNDLQKATEIARVMVTEYGMSDKIGPLALEGSGRSQFLNDGGAPMFGTRNFSEKTAEIIDSEVRRLVEEAAARARDILTERRDILEKLALRLLENEVIEKDELLELAGAPAWELRRRRKAQEADDTARESGKDPEGQDGNGAQSRNGNGARAGEA